MLNAEILFALVRFTQESFRQDQIYALISGSALLEPNPLPGYSGRVQPVAPLIFGCGELRGSLGLLRGRLPESPLRAPARPALRKLPCRRLLSCPRERPLSSRLCRTAPGMPAQPPSAVEVPGVFCIAIALNVCEMCILKEIRKNSSLGRNL